MWFEKVNWYSQHCQQQQMPIFICVEIFLVVLGTPSCSLLVAIRSLRLSCSCGTCRVPDPSLVVGPKLVLVTLDADPAVQLVVAQQKRADGNTADFSLPCHHHKGLLESKRVS
jgi:hypothetical protein